MTITKLLAAGIAIAISSSAALAQGYPGTSGSPSSGQGAAGPPPLGQGGNPCLGYFVALRTVDGHFLTMVNGGGLGGPNNGSIALHTDATTPRQWETFTFERVDANPNHIALKTLSGYYVTAVNGGGIGGPNDATSPVHTDASQIGQWERLSLSSVNRNGCTIQTRDGHYVTAVNGGGVGGPATAIHTDATKVGAWETFEVLQFPR